MTDDGLCRIGWSTLNATLDLGKRGLLAFNVLSRHRQMVIIRNR